MKNSAQSVVEPGPESATSGEQRTSTTSSMNDAGHVMAPDSCSSLKPATTVLFKALLQAKRKFKTVTKDAANPHFRSKYATLEGVLDAIEEPLEENGLLFGQYRKITPNGDELITRVIHVESGEFYDGGGGGIPILTSKKDSQGMGSGLTYARRQSALTFFGIAPSDDDDDGNASSSASMQRGGGATRKTALPPRSQTSTGPSGPQPGSPSSGSAPATNSRSSAPPPQKSTLSPQQQAVMQAAHSNGWEVPQVQQFMKAAYNRDKIQALDQGQLDELIQVIGSNSFQDAMAVLSGRG